MVNKLNPPLTGGNLLLYWNMRYFKLSVISMKNKEKRYIVFSLMLKNFNKNLFHTFLLSCIL